MFLGLTRYCTVFRDENISLCPDQVREFSETVEPGVEIWLQFCQVATERSKMCPATLVGRLLEGREHEFPWERGIRRDSSSRLRRD
ncbi:hypothetical protein CBM2592_A190012 [Cupriavidus taiwanensis]|nr:hypothetical protein CBM2592_A190012 [Cupriavidus taiwanensis]SOY83036.1 hypothetical protein CBM2591_A230014 [Cupriavidus taiwanensis]SOZ56213.1 hypothetical protein CBM2617_A200020 [Cupriavidus taiwanensis]SOZ79078.1 hypothetical protein CBM2622_A170019 [Cupriavidus taiwanensis]SOZ86315.1 hypothetical protein CBM2621_A170021 [Cupriavidus taiwanensis]